MIGIAIEDRCRVAVPASASQSTVDGIEPASTRVFGVVNPHQGAQQQHAHAYGDDQE
jgi:hypothetical protein